MAKGLSNHKLQPLEAQALLPLNRFLPEFCSGLEVFLELLQLCEVRGLPLPPRGVVLRVRPFGEEVGLSFSLTRGPGDFNPKKQILGYAPNFGECIKYFFLSVYNFLRKGVHNLAHLKNPENILSKNSQ